MDDRWTGRRFGQVSSCFARHQLGFSVAMAGLPLAVMHEGYIYGASNARVMTAVFIMCTNVPCGHQSCVQIDDVTVDVIFLRMFRYSSVTTPLCLYQSACVFME